MKVLLLHSNFFSFAQLPRRIEKQRGLNPPISLLYVAAGIRKFSHHDVIFYDLDVEKAGLKDLRRILEEFKPDVVGFSVLINNIIYVNRYAESIKKINPNIIIIYGGVLLDLYPEFVMENEAVDIGIIGEGDFSIVEVLNKLENHEPLDDVKGIIFRRGNEIIKTEPRLPIKDMDSIPFPAREISKYKKYTSLIAKNNPITIQITSRGCGFHCNFCYKPSFYQGWRFHSPEYVVNEIESILDLGIKEIMFYDSNFTINKKRVLEICDRIIDKGLEFSWDIRTRVDLVDEEILDALKSAGCYRICYGIESGDDRVLKFYNKQITREQVYRAVKLTKKAKMQVLAYFMIGAPIETHESAQNTINTFLDLPIDYLHLTHVIPYPGTDLFNIAKEMGIVDDNTWKDYHVLTYENFPMFDTGTLTREEIFNYIRKGYRKFYLRPKYILRQFKNIYNVKTLIRQARAALSIVEDEYH